MADELVFPYGRIEFTYHLMTNAAGINMMDEIPAPRGVPAASAAGGLMPERPESATFPARAVSILCLACG